MGAVWEARQHHPDRLVALKVMRADIVLPVAAERFQQEMDLAASLSHSGIAHVYDGGEAQGLLYYTMELVPEGRSLQTFLAEAEPDLEQRVKLLREVCDAVAFAHEHGVVHRDLKPSNILVTPDGKIKVADFGLAKSLDNELSRGLSVAGEVKGTPAYMSPEQARGESDLNASSDVFSLGSMLFVAISEELPWRTDGDSLSFSEQIQHHASKDLRQLVPEIPADLRAIIEKAMEKSPAHRYQDAGKLAADLQAFSDHQPISFRANAPVYVAKKWMRRHRARLTRSTVIVTVVSLVLALVLSWGLFSMLYEPGRKIALQLPLESLDLGNGSSLQFQAVPDSESFIMSDPVSADAWLAASLAVPGNVEQEGDDPVYSLSAAQANTFCDWLNARYDGPQGSVFRLATVRELESAMDPDGSGIEWATFDEDGTLHHAIRTGADAGLSLSRPDGALRLLWREFPDTVWPGVQFRAVYGPKTSALDVVSSAAGRRPLVPNLEAKTLTLPLGRSESLHLARVESGDFLTRGVNIKVAVTRPFWMATTETTQGQYEAVVGTRLAGDLSAIYPANSLGRAQAFAFCNLANERLQAAKLLPNGYELRLPTDSEWEYVCSEGASLTFAPVIKLEKERTGNIAKYANTDEPANGEVKLRPVASYKPTTWGFFDLNGNVAEWVYDDYVSDRHNRLKRFLPNPDGYQDPIRILSGDKALDIAYIVRGGHWKQRPGDCACGRRVKAAPDLGDARSGFRCVVGPVIADLNRLGNTK